MLNAIKTIQKPHKKIFISGIIVSFIMFFSVFSIAEGWHFRGGTVEDIINGIKQTVEKVKQSEIAQQYDVLKEYQKEYNSVLKELKSFGEEVQSLAHADIFDMKLDGVLAAQNQTQKDIKDRMMEIDFSKEGLTSETLKENSKRFDAMQEQEILNTVQRANQMQDFETAIQTQVDKILADRQSPAEKSAGTDKKCQRDCCQPSSNQRFCRTHAPARRSAYRPGDSDAEQLRDSGRGQRVPQKKTGRSSDGSFAALI